MVEEIKAGILQSLNTVLGSEWGELPFLVNVDRNNFSRNNNRYGVLTQASLETGSVTKYFTVLQTFEVVLTKAYIDDGVGDQDRQEKSVELQDRVLDVYKDLINTKANRPAYVMNITDLTLSSSEYLEESQVVIQRASFNILYRISLI